MNTTKKELSMAKIAKLGVGTRVYAKIDLTGEVHSEWGVGAGPEAIIKARERGELSFYEPNGWYVDFSKNRFCFTYFGEFNQEFTLEPAMTIKRKEPPYDELGEYAIIEHKGKFALYNTHAQKVTEEGFETKGKALKKGVENRHLLLAEISQATGLPVV